MSTAASARYNVKCPRCGAEPHEPCRTLEKRRVTDTHLVRIDAWFDAVMRQGDAK